MAGVLTLNDPAGRINDRQPERSVFVRVADGGGY
jgi:hypothetical protein